MLNRSVFENVTFDSNADNKAHKKVYALLENVHLGEVAKSLPNGLDEEVGDFGARFSAGQKQRLAFARVLAHDKSFFVLDESTSNLDMKVENKIIDLLEKLNNNLAIIIISHKNTSLKKCKKIYEINNNKIHQIK